MVALLVVIIATLESRVVSACRVGKKPNVTRFCKKTNKQIHDLIDQIKTIR